jgi:ABC-type dipeptide/oligopeptide/nickel transport system ATPase component
VRRTGPHRAPWIALASAHETEALLPDEPATFPNLAYQLEAPHLFRNLNRDAGRTIVVVHDLNHAGRFAHHIVAIRDGAAMNGAIVARGFGGAPTSRPTPGPRPRTARLRGHRDPGRRAGGGMDGGRL